MDALDKFLRRYKADLVREGAGRLGGVDGSEEGLLHVSPVDGSGSGRARDSSSRLTGRSSRFTSSNSSSSSPCRCCSCSKVVSVCFFEKRPWLPRPLKVRESKRVGSRV